MTVAAFPAPSGLAAVDRQWGGFITGRTYLLVGRAGAGRSALAFQSVQAALDEGMSCLLISPRPPETLVDVAQSVGLDLAQAHNAGTLRILKIPAAADLAKRGSDGLAASYRDLIELIETDRPGRVVIEDFTPLVQFETFERFGEAFASMVDAIGRLGTTVLLGLGTPANDASHRLINVVKEHAHGTIQMSATGNVILSLPAAAPAAPDAAGFAPIDPADDPSGDPVTPDDPPVLSMNDGASFETDAPTATPSVAAGPPHTDVIPPPPAPPAFLLPTDDSFPVDPADEIMAQGFLADSQAGAPAVGPATDAPMFPLPADEPFAPPPAPAALPTFAPLAASPDDAFRTALAASFDARAGNTKFLVIAARLDATQPESDHFAAVAGAIRTSLRPCDTMLADIPRGRAIVLLPASGPEAGQAFSARLQSNLRQSLGAQADAVLAAVAAVTIPDGQPFSSGQDLMAYAYES